MTATPGKSLKLCFVSRDWEGINNDSGVGIATRRLCERLAAEGYDLSVFITGGELGGDLKEKHRNECLAKNIKLDFIMFDANVFHYVERRAYQVYTVLKETDFDVYVFHDWQADGFFCFLAKETGVAFQGKALGVIAHGGTAWRHEAERRFLGSEHTLALAEMERACVEKADFLISPSAYMLDWLRAQGWALPADSVVLPYVGEPPVPHPKAAKPKAAKPKAASDVLHFAFFGRLEERKGFRLLIDALNELDEPTLSKIQVSFVGKGSDFTQKLIMRDMFNERTVKLLKGIQFHRCLRPAEELEYLVANNCVAVIPSLLDNSPFAARDCLERGIPMLLSNSGGAKEMLHKDELARVTFAPKVKDLAAKLVAIVGSGRPPAPARRAFSGKAILDQWKAFLDGRASGSAKGRAMRARKSAPPLVSVVLVHHNRPCLVGTALDSLLAQDYPNLEVLLVDDGSDDPMAIRNLEDIERRLASPRLRIIRQENRYLGAARNHGWREAKGDYVVFFDDDNVAMPHMVSTLANAALLSGADCVTTAMRFLHRQIGPPAFTDKFQPACVFWGGAARTSGLLINHFGDATGIYKKSILQKTGGFHEIRGVTHEDWQLHLDIQMAGGRTASVPDVLFWYRVVKNSMYRSTSEYLNAKQSLGAVEKRLPPQFSEMPSILWGFKKEVEGITVERDSLKKHLGDHRGCIRKLLKMAYRQYPPVDEDQIRAVRESGLFDSDFYLSQEPRLADTPKDLLEHFMRHGFMDGRKPHPLFDPMTYMILFTEVIPLNPFYHYVTEGRFNPEIRKLFKL